MKPNKREGSPNYKRYPSSPGGQGLTRREFLRLGEGLAIGALTSACSGLWLSGCNQQPVGPTAQVPIATSAIAGPEATNTPLAATTSTTAATTNHGETDMNTPEPGYAELPRAMQRGVDKDGWRILGPGGGGAMYIPTVKPDDADTALVACDMTGAYLTRDGGQTWREFNLRSRVVAFAFDPSNTRTIYAGSTGLYRSTDVGETWELVFPNPAAVTGERTVGDHAEHAYLSTDNWPGGRVEAIHVDPGDAQRLWIGVNSGGLKIYASPDGGQSWAEGCALEGGQFIRSFLDPASPAQDRRLFILTDAALYRIDLQDISAQKLPAPPAEELISLGFGVDAQLGASILYLTTPARWDGAQFRSGVYRSADLGQTWIELSEGLDADLPRYGFRRFTCISCCLGDARVVYLAASEPTGDGAGSAGGQTYFGIFKSEDRGDTWQWALRIGKENPPNRLLGWVEADFSTEWGGAPFYIGVSPADPRVAYVTDWGTTYRTVDGGATWQQLYCQPQTGGTVTTRGLDVTNTYWVCFDPFDKRRLALTCTDIGLFLSQDGGKSWKHAQEGVPRAWANTCYALVFDPQAQGVAWSVWSECHDLPRPKMFRSGRFSQYRGGVCKSADGLATWQQSSKGLPANCAPTDIVLDPASPVGKRTLYLAVVGKGVYKSVDDGATWQAKNAGIYGNLNAWRIVRLPDGTLYLLVCRGLEVSKVIDGALYRSTDGAETWQAVSLPQGSNFPNDLAYDPTDPQRLYLACWPVTIDGQEHYGGLYRSADGGASWANIFDPASHAYGVAVDPRSPETVYLTTFEGAIYRSDDGGDTWQKLPGYDFKWAKQPIPDPYNPGMLYVSTFGSSLWYGKAGG